MATRTRASGLAVLLLLILATAAWLLLPSRGPGRPRAVPRAATEQRSERITAVAATNPEQDPRRQPQDAVPRRQVLLAVAEAESRLPVEGAELLAVDGLLLRSMGKTDSIGLLELGSELPQEELWVMADGYVPSEAPQPPIEEAATRVRVEVALERSGAIRGHVRLPSGETPSETLTVYASPHADIADPEILAAATERDPRVHRARTRADGSFVIEGVRHELPYFVDGAGEGLVVEKMQYDVRADLDHVELVVKPLYAIVLEPREVGGGPLRGTGNTSDPSGISFSRLIEGLEPLHARRRALLLAGLDPDDVRSGPSRDRLLLSYTSEIDWKSVLVNYAYSVPGYLPRSGSVAIPRYVHGAPLPTHRFDLVEAAGGWGEIHVEWVEVDSRLASGRTSGWSTTLRLDSDQGSGLSVPLAMPREGVEEAILVPIGTYSASVRLEASRLRLPRAGPVRVVVSDEPARLRISASGLRNLRVRVPTPFGRERRGEALIRIQRSGERGLHHVRFLEPPYVLHSLEPREYVISALDARNFPPPGAEPYRALVDLSDPTVEEITLEAGH